jgi:hypothetical protein
MRGGSPKLGSLAGSATAGMPPSARRFGLCTMMVLTLPRSVGRFPVGSEVTSARSGEPTGAWLISRERTSL